MEMKFLTIGEVAKLLKLSRDTIYQLARRGELPGRKVGRSWRFSGRALEEFISADPRPHPLEERNRMQQGPMV